MLMAKVKLTVKVLKMRKLEMPEGLYVSQIPGSSLQ